MVEYNKGGSNTRRKEVGEDITLYLPEGVSTPVSSVSFSEEAETSEVQYTDSFAQNIAVTGVTYSGSFEVPGNANIERAVGWDDGTTGDAGTTLPKYISTMTIEDTEKTYTFSNVLLNSHSKDMPSDDRTTESFDFMAETLTVNDA